MSNDPMLDSLFSVISDQQISRKLRSILGGVQARLDANPAWPQAWEPLSLDLFGSRLPEEIRSCWFFVLRAGAMFGAERHPNSHQRSFALEGSALFEVFAQKAWVHHPISATTKADAEKAISIPVNTWHRIAIGPTNFVSLSFHTVPANELIEETPDGDDLTKTQRRLYNT